MGESFAVNVSAKLDNKLANDARGSQQPKTASSQHASFCSDTYMGAPSSGWPLQPSLFLPVSPPPTVSVLQESECVLERLQKQKANMVREVTQLRSSMMRSSRWHTTNQWPVQLRKMFAWSVTGSMPRTH